MPLRLHDTMSRGLRELVPLEAGVVRLYTCGPTVWNRAHIGNFRTFLFEDVLRRVLEQRFDRVVHVMNLTDVDDRLITNARAHGRALSEETAPWIEAFFEDVDTLGIRRAHHYPRATEFVEEMVSLVERLSARGVTYASEGSIYFHIGSFPRYGRLSGVDARGLRAGGGGRIDADDYDKEDARDFALWKAVGPDDIGWDTRLGRGRPGWHLECSAMSMTLLGESFDIHCGGVDNIFPHHENEIAQSEAATGRPFVSLWAHAAHLRIDDEKMSKRLGNILTVPEVISDEGARPSTVRFLLIAAAHYRKTLNFGADGLHQAAEQVDRLATFRDRLGGAVTSRDGSVEAVELAAQAQRRFDEALDDDLNVPGAVGELSVAVREANRLLDAGPVSDASIANLRRLVERAEDVLGVLPLVDREREAALDAGTRALLLEREQARAGRDFARSDRLRDELRERGVVVEDTPRGQRWRPST